MPLKREIAHLDGDTRTCSVCKEVKPLDEYHRDSKDRNLGRAYACKPCAIARSRYYHRKRMVEDEEYRTAKRNSYIKSAHGISLEQYEDKLRDQGSSCAICCIPLESSGYRTHLDHCHTTGKLRDFLCTNCNRGLGHFQDNEEFLMRAVDYLSTWRDKHAT